MSRQHRSCNMKRYMYRRHLQIRSKDKGVSVRGGSHQSYREHRTQLDLPSLVYV